MKPTVTVVDYGVGNLLSVARALEHCGASVVLAAKAQEIIAASHLLLPGVGAFADGMSQLRERGLIDAIRSFALTGRPMLGVCLGMQLLLASSEEFGEHAGLGIIAGTVKAIPAVGVDGRSHKIPHIGWNSLKLPPKRSEWSTTILAGIPEDAAVYFVHSFAAVPDDPSDRLADVDYDGQVISAALQKGQISGCQFHPEKSGETGLQVLRNFISMS